MKASEFKKEMKVRVSNNISATTKKYSSNRVMNRMKGKIFTLESLNSQNTGGFIIMENDKYIFDLTDLHPIGITPPPPQPPVMFDPENILNEGE